MKTYLGVKLVEAEPMDAGDACNRLSMTMKRPADSPGYLVKCPDGYQSWCPKEQFERANLEIDSTDEMTPADVSRFINSPEVVIDNRFLAVIHDGLNLVLSWGTAGLPEKGSFNFAGSAPQPIAEGQTLAEAEAADEAPVDDKAETKIFQADFSQNK